MREICAHSEDMREKYAICAFGQNMRTLLPWPRLGLESCALPRIGITGLGRLANLSTMVLVL